MSLRKIRNLIMYALATSVGVNHFCEHARLFEKSGAARKGGSTISVKVSYKDGIQTCRDQSEKVHHGQVPLRALQ
jgi:hypothetical protein